MSEWQDIATAPKKIVTQTYGHEFGPYVLAWPIHGEVARVRWWQSKRDPAMVCNWLEDGGNSVSPKVWQHLPAPPVEETR